MRKLLIVLVIGVIAWQAWSAYQTRNAMVRRQVLSAALTDLGAGCWSRLEARRQSSSAPAQLSMSHLPESCMVSFPPSLSAVIDPLMRSRPRASIFIAV